MIPSRRVEAHLAVEKPTTGAKGVLRTAVVIPALNEARTIQGLTARAAQHCDIVVVVDDGSEDGTADLLVDASATVLRHGTRRGKAASLWRGMVHSLDQGMDAVITMDGDGQHQPEDIPGLIAAAESAPGRIVIATRLRQREKMPAARQFGNAMADFWIGWAAGYPIRDTQSGFRLYPSCLLHNLDLPHDAAHGFVFESEILIEAARLGYFAMPVSIDCIYQDTFRPSHYRPVRDTLRIIRMVALRLIRQRMHPMGLLRSVGLLGKP